MLLNDFAEMITVDAEAYGNGEFPRLLQQGRKEQLPVVSPSLFSDTQEPYRFEERPDMVRLQSAGCSPARFIFP